MITVVIPVRNRGELVRRTLQSLAAQSVAPEAVVLVDNGSSDHTLDTLTQWAESRPGVTVISEPQPGATCARNAGLACVKTPYVMFFDSDDVMPVRHIEEVSAGLNAAGKPQIGAFDMVLTGLDGKEHRKPFRHGDPMRMQIFHSILSTQRCVVSSSLVRSVGKWNCNLPGWNDWELGIRLLAATSSLAYLSLSEPVRVYAQAESITGTDFSSKAGRWEAALDAAAQTLAGTKYARLIDYRRAILAGMYCREGHAELAKGMAKGWRLKLVERYVAAGGRGVALLERLLR